MTKVLCLGEALVDLVCEQPVDGLADAPSFVPHPGGAMANQAIGCARHGGSAALVGGAGADGFGDWLRARLTHEGVDLSWFALVPETPTAVAFVTVDAHGEPDFLIHGDGIRAALRAAGDHVGEAVRGCGALAIASNTLVHEDERALTLAAREQALAEGKPVVLDPNLRLGRWASADDAVAVVRPCVSDAFLVKCNGAEARLLTGEQDLEAAAAALVDAGARHVVITLGPDGAMLRGAERADAPGVAAKVVNTTGAGDAFAGALLAALSQTGFYGPALAAALRGAVAAGAAATERWGAL